MSPTQPSSILLLYAELLLHVRTVTLFASLRTHHTAQTKAALSADGETISLTHEGETATVRLPTHISGGGSAALTLPESPSKELTLRLQLQEKAPGLLRLEERRKNAVPWDAPGLGGCVRIACGRCGEELVAATSPGAGSQGSGVAQWMDLPNEDWAELMDFWHCHKPHHAGQSAEAGGDKGYAAANRITAKQGAGYVDLASLLFAEADCRNVQPVRSFGREEHAQDEPERRVPLACSSCHAVVGATDSRAEGWRLWKWAVSVARKDSPEPQKFATPKWLSAQLLALIDNQGVRKFHVTPDPPGSVQDADAALEPVVLWVFTPDLSFSSSIASERRTDPTRAMKVLWKPAPMPPSLPQPARRGSAQHKQPAAPSGAGGLVSTANKTQGQALDKQSLSVEDLSLPRPAFKALKDALASSASWLPPSTRRFQDWHVALVERFEDSGV